MELGSQLFVSSICKWIKLNTIIYKSTITFCSLKQNRPFEVVEWSTVFWVWLFQKWYKVQDRYLTPRHSVGLDYFQCKSFCKLSTFQHLNKRQESWSVLSVLKNASCLVSCLNTAGGRFRVFLRTQSDMPTLVSVEPYACTLP